MHYPTDVLAGAALGTAVAVRRLARRPVLDGDNHGTDVLALTSLLPELPTARTRLLDNLGRVRREVGPVTPELSDAVADHMNIRRGEVHEVVSFYSFLREPVDVVRVCTGPVCDCMGARAGDGELAVACVGHCDLAPVRMDGDDDRRRRHAPGERLPARAGRAARAAGAGAGRGRRAARGRPA